MKKKLFILLGVLVLGAIIFAAALPSILKGQGLHPDYTDQVMSFRGSAL